MIFLVLSLKISYYESHIDIPQVAPKLYLSMDN